MVKLTGPALAEGAAGSLGGVLVFANWRGRSYAKKLTAPAQPLPTQQRGGRAALKFLTEQWKNIDPANQATWENYPQLPHLDIFHRYVQENLRTWHNGQAPSQVWPATRTGTNPGIAIWSGAAQGRRIQHDLNIIILNDGWGVIVLRDTAPFTVLDWQKIVHIVPAYSSGHKYWSDGPLDPATYHHRSWRFTDDGNTSVTGAGPTVTIS